MTTTLVPRGLRVRLILLMTLVLFPLGLIAIWQTAVLVRDSRQIAFDLLYEATEAAAADQRALIQRAVGAASGLGAIARQADLSACRTSMNAFVRDNPRFAFAGFIAADGTMRCGSGAAQVVDFSNHDSFRAAMDRADVFVEVNTRGAVSGAEVLVVSVPMFDTGVLAGLMSV